MSERGGQRRDRSGGGGRKRSARLDDGGEIDPRGTLTGASLLRVSSKNARALRGRSSPWRLERFEERQPSERAKKKREAVVDDGDGKPPSATSVAAIDENPLFVDALALACSPSRSLGVVENVTGDRLAERDRREIGRSKPRAPGRLCQRKIVDRGRKPPPIPSYLTLPPVHASPVRPFGAQRRRMREGEDLRQSYLGKSL